MGKGSMGSMGLVMVLVLVLVLGSVLAQERPRPRLVGAPVEASLEDAGTQRALQFAMELYNRGSNDAYHSRVAEVVSAHKQIVAGLKYIFTVKIGRTHCRKSEAVVENCEFSMEPELAKQAVCTFEVYTVPWNNVIKLLKNDCQ